MKLPVRNRSGETENLGDYCVRSFSKENDSSEGASSIPLYSGVPTPTPDGKRQVRKFSVQGARRGKVIT